MSASYPFISFPVQEFLAQACGMAEGAWASYTKLIAQAWEFDDCTLPDDDEELAALAGCSLAQWRKRRPKLSRFFTVAGGRWCPKILAKSRARTVAMCEKTRAAANARWERARRSNPLKTPDTTHAYACADDDALHTYTYTDTEKTKRDPATSTERVDAGAQAQGRADPAPSPEPDAPGASAAAAAAGPEEGLEASPQDEPSLGRRQPITRPEALAVSKLLEAADPALVLYEPLRDHLWGIVGSRGYVSRVQFERQLLGLAERAGSAYQLENCIQALFEKLDARSSIAYPMRWLQAAADNARKNPYLGDNSDGAEPKYENPHDAVARIVLERAAARKAAEAAKLN